MSSERVKSVNTPTLKSLQRRWQRKTGEPMPEWIARLDLPLVERAVKLTEAGMQVVMPSEPVEARDGFGYGIQCGSGILIAQAEKNFRNLSGMPMIVVDTRKADVKM
jgi:hypothetical protein